jgi:pyruvate/2-oxoglutarate dehydrogenase complex dihydrolipoamide dehydrogenase (E3) component
LLAAGRRPNVEGLNLAAANVQHQPDGILIDRRFRTSNRSVYAIGDATGLPQFTHAAGHEASLLVRHLLFRLPVKFKENEIPRVTFTDPELAHVGLTADEARRRRFAIRVMRWSFRENDRAQAEGTARGHIKVVTNRRGAILGATIVGPAASEQITAWTLAIANKLNIRAFAEIVMPYPTYSEVGKRAAISFFTPRLNTSWVRRLLKFMRRLG